MRLSRVVNLFLYSSGAPRDLHSFPTRRSSDLPVADLKNLPSGPLYIPQIADGSGFRTQFILMNTSAAQRSEEHTSELQSHSDLVCRLLLEKKKSFAAATRGGAQRRRASASRAR